jgi:hypothetical protein
MHINEVPLFVKLPSGELHPSPESVQLGMVEHLTPQQREALSVQAERQLEELKQASH